MLYVAVSTVTCAQHRVVRVVRDVLRLPACVVAPGAQVYSEPLEA
jgi:hypothetical protein